MSILPIINTGGNPDDALQWSSKSNANFQFLNDQIEAINNTSPAAPPTQNTYQDNDQMVASYNDQSIGFFQFVQDARTPTEIANGDDVYASYYEYLGPTNNTIADYRKLSQQEAQQLLVTPFNQLTIKQITADNIDFTSANHGVSFVYNQENNCIDYVVFSPAFSKYMLNYMGYLEGYNLVLQVWNTTEGKAIALNITDLQFTNSTEVFIKAVVENTVVISDINVADVVNIDVSLSRFKNITQVERYEDIPLKVGNYSVIVVDSEQGFEIDLKTNVYKYEDDTQLNILDFVTNSESSYMIINRMILSAEGEIDDEEQNPIDLKFVDYFYDSEGVFIGFLRLSDNNSKVIINENIFLSKSVVFDNVYINTKDLGYSVTDLVYKGFLKVSINNTNFNNGLVTIPVEFPNGFEHIDSSVYLGSKKISGYEINVISDDSNNFLGLRDYSGDLINSKLKGDLFIYIKYKEKDSQGISKTLNNTAVNVLNLEVSDLSHSNSMKLTFQEVYGTFTGTVFNAGSSNISDFANLKNITSELDTQNVDFVFSAEGFPNILKNYYFNNSLSVLPIGSNSNVRQDLTEAIDVFPSNYIAVTARADDDDDGTDPLGTSYGFGTEFYEPTWSTDLIAQGLTNWSNNNTHSQSIATAIVAGKLKYIKDQTGASWVNVREAARRSASNYGNYNIYQGFGKIDTALAISLMPTVISERSQELADYWKAVTPFNQDLQFEDKSDYTPAVKKDIADKFVEKVGDVMTGKLVIGTGIPGYYNLNVRDVIGIQATSGLSELVFRNTSGAVINNVNSTPLVFKTGNTTRLTIENNGDVTIVGNLKSKFYKSTGDISTTAFAFVNGNTGSLDYTVSNNRLIINGTFDTTGTASGAIIGTLPTGARPTITRTKTFYQGNGVLKLEIFTNGNIQKTTNSTETFDIDFEITLDLASV